MAKYYCISGDFKLILDAPDEKTAANKFLKKAISKKRDFGWLMSIGENGFNQSKMSFMACIPVLKKIGYNFSDDNMLLEIICFSLGLKRELLTEDFAFWILNGEDSKNNGF